MEDDLRWKTTFDGRRSSMEDDNEDNLKNKEDLHIAGRHTVMDIFRFVVSFKLRLGVDSTFRQQELC